MLMEIRRLIIDNVPAVAEITKIIWDGNDYLKNVIAEWINSNDCFPFGAFIDDQLVGVGNIRRTSTNSAWLEGLRVNPAMQGQGIAHALFDFAVNYTLENDFQIVQFDASSNTKASLHMGEEFGFVQKYQVSHLLATIEQLTWDHQSEYTSKQIIGKQAVDFLQKTLKLTEFCVGWAYFRVSTKYLSAPHWVWYVSKHGILLRRLCSEKDHDESPDSDELRLIIYGPSEECYDLLSHAMEDLSHDEQSSHLKDVSLYCPMDFVSMASEMGFHNPQYKDEERETRVILLEKTKI